VGQGGQVCRPQGGLRRQIFHILRSGECDKPGDRCGSRLCENAPSRDLLRIFFLGRALTMMSEDFLAAVSPSRGQNSTLKKSRPSFHTAWVMGCPCNNAGVTTGVPRIAADFLQPSSWQRTVRVRFSPRLILAGFPEYLACDCPCGSMEIVSTIVHHGH